MRYKLKLGMLLGVILGSLLTINVEAQGPFSAQIQRAINALLANGMAFTAASSVTVNGIAATPTAGFSLNNTTLSTAGVPVQMPPCFSWNGHVWNTTAVAADNTDQFSLCSVPATATAPRPKFTFLSSLNGASATHLVDITSNGMPNQIARLAVWENIPGSAGEAVVLDGYGGSYFDNQLRIGSSGADGALAVSSDVTDAVSTSLSLTTFNVGAGPNFIGNKWGNDANPVGLFTFKTRRAGDGAASTAVQNADAVFKLSAYGASGSVYMPVGALQLFVDGAVATNVIPGRWEFSTQNIDTGALAIAQTIDTHQKVSFTTSLGLGVSGVVMASATAPTIASGGCTSPAITNANGTAKFRVTLGTTCTGIKTVTLTLPASANAWQCDVTDNTSPITYVVATSSASTTAVLLSNILRSTGAAADFVDGEVLLVKCMGG